MRMLLVGKRITKEIVDRIKKAGIDRLVLRKTNLVRSRIWHGCLDPDTGEVVFEQGTNYYR